MDNLAGLTPTHTHAWLAFLRAHADLMRLLDGELVAKHGLSLGEYEVLAFLGRAPDHRMRMSDLARHALVSAGGLTRRVERLEGKGLVTRERDERDSRVVHAKLTRQGKATLKALIPTHLRGIRTHFLDVMSERELETIARALRKVSESCQAD